MILNLKKFSEFYKLPLNFAKSCQSYNYPRKMFAPSNNMMQLRNKSSKIKLTVDPLLCLHDEKVNITAKGLNPGAEVTLTVSTQDSNKVDFFSYVHYKADNSGCIDLEKHEAIGGSYQGSFAMGPIACLLSINESISKLFFVNEFTSPILMKMNLLEGYLGKSEASKPDLKLILDTTIHERIFMGAGCKRIPVKYGRIRGTLFLPAGDGPFPGVIDLLGMRGGLIESKSAMLASRGIASLALAYFNYDDLPKIVEFIDMEYFEEAVHFLLGHEKIKKPSVGVIGASKGGDIALAMGTFIPQVKAVICVNGLPVNVWFPLKVNGKEIPGLKGDFSKIKRVSGTLSSVIDVMYDSEDYPETWLPLHEADAEFLFLVGKDDRNWKTEKEVLQAIARLKAKGKSNFQVSAYDGTGHFLEPPYTPFYAIIPHGLQRGCIIFWGGNAKDNTNAQVHAWDLSLNFFKTVLY